MRSIRNIAFSALLTFGAFSAITYTSCNKDECKDITCGKGTCTDGTCDCPSGYDGDRCQTTFSSKIVGTYSATETCQPPVAAGDEWSSTLTVSSADETKIVIANFGASGNNISGRVDQNAIILDEATFGGNTVKGTGTIAGNVITINYTLTGALTSYSCTMVMQKR